MVRLIEQVQMVVLMYVIRLVAVFVNSFYSFYWDVAKDWDLTLFSNKRERDDPEHPWGLRKHRYSAYMRFTMP